jgi:ABC-type multidrug transport system permease subunit
LKLKNYQIEYSDVLPNEAFSHWSIKMKIYKNKIFSLSNDSFYIFSISEKKIIEEINYNRSFRNFKITENGNIFAYRSNNIYKLDLKTKKAYKIIGVNVGIESLNIMEKDKNLFFIVNNKYIYYYSENIRYKYFFVNILQNLIVLLYTLLSSILFSIFLKINLISNLIAFFVIMFLSFLFDIVPYDLGLIIIRFIYFIKLIYHNIIDIRKEILGSLAKLIVIGFIYALTFIIDLLGYTSNKIYRRQIHNRGHPI